MAILVSFPDSTTRGVWERDYGHIQRKVMRHYQQICACVVEVHVLFLHAMRTQACKKAERAQISPSDPTFTHLRNNLVIINYTYNIIYTVINNKAAKVTELKLHTLNVCMHTHK